jgi:hypothetical protein
VDDENSLSMDFVFWEDTVVAFPGPKGRVGHPDLTQNISVSSSRVSGGAVRRDRLVLGLATG